MDSEEDNPAKLRAENRKLEKELRALVVEKNLMEHKLYRAFHKLLQSKKRKIEELERKIKRMKGEDPDGAGGVSDGRNDKDNHCKTCRCNGQSPRKKKRLAEEERVNGGQAAMDQDEDGGSDTQDPFAGSYSDETDVDEEPASKSNSKNASPSKTVVVSCHEPSGVSSSIEEVSSGPAASTSKPPKSTEVITVDSTVKDVTPAASNKKTQKKQPEVLPDSQKSSSDDLDTLVDEFCA